MFSRFLVSILVLVLTRLALSFPPGSAVPTPTAVLSATGHHQSSVSSVVTVTQQSVTTNEANGLTQKAVPPPPPAQTTPGKDSTPVAPPTLLLQRAELAADNKTAAEKKPEEAPAEKKSELEPAPANVRKPKCVKKTQMGMIGDSFYQAPSLVRTYDITELEQEGVSDSDMEEKLTLAMRRKCRLINDWHYFASKGDGKGATLLFSTHLWDSKKCVQEAVIEAGFPKDFNC